MIRDLMKKSTWPAPLEHRPQVDQFESDGCLGIVLVEDHTDALIHCENPVKVEQ